MVEVIDTDIRIAQTTVRKIKPTESLWFQDEVAVEEPLEIQLITGKGENEVRRVVAVTMRTPGNDEELALGFLFTEGIVQNCLQVKNVEITPGENRVSVRLSDGVAPTLSKLDRNFYTTSSCGVCGKTSIDAIKTVSAFSMPTGDSPVINSKLLYQLAAGVGDRQKVFSRTGGLHASALFQLDGNFDLLREDVGRHNALDKLIGSKFQSSELPLDNRLLFLSGRASFELIQKSAMAGIRLVAAIGAPSSLAVKLAVESGITLVGFLRPDSLNVYSGAGCVV